MGKSTANPFLSEDSCTLAGARKPGALSCTSGQGHLFPADEHELWREFLDALTWDEKAPGARNEILSLLRVGERTWLNYLNRNNRNNLPLAKFVKLVGKNLLPKALDRLCGFAGGLFICIPDTRAAAVNMESIQRLQAESASLVEALANIPPGDIEIARLKCRVLMRLVASMMKGLER